MEYLFQWLYNSDEPLTYLWGRGGSGKTTIAHEFSTLVKRYCGKINIFGPDQLDLIIYVSAKEKSFEVAEKGGIYKHEADFYDEKSLYIKLLIFSGLFSEEENLDRLDLTALRRHIVDFFDEFSCLVILDDIDTLTTKNIEVGTSYLNRIIGRAKRTSKVLCTQRDAPEHAISNSKEVPGLDMNGEFEQFIKECALEYHVKEPDRSSFPRIATVTGRRPLVLQYIVAMLRTCPNVETALRLYEGDIGEDIRSYVFSREWSNLSYGQDSRTMLAALATMSRAASFEDLLSILQYGEGKLRDAIAATRAMFLHITTAGSDTTYSLDAITRAFVLSEASDLSLIGTIRMRVKMFEKSYFPEIPQITRIGVRVTELVRKANRLTQPSYITDAWNIVNDAKLLPGTTEHPQFKSILGYVASKCIPPKLIETRSAFKAIMSTSYEPPLDYLRAWFDAERDSGIGFDSCMLICDFIRRGKSYDQQSKTDAGSLKATAMYYRACDKINDDPVESASLLTQSLKLHAEVYRQNFLTNNPKYAISERYLRNTGYTLLSVIVKSFRLDEIMRQILEIFSISIGYLDPLEQPVLEYIGRLQVLGFEKAVLHRSKKMFAMMPDVSADLWIDSAVWSRIKAEFAKLEQKIDFALQKKS